MRFEKIPQTLMELKIKMRDYQHRRGLLVKQKMNQIILSARQKQKQPKRSKIEGFVGIFVRYCEMKESSTDFYIFGFLGDLKRCKFEKVDLG